MLMIVDKVLSVQGPRGYITGQKRPHLRHVDADCVPPYHSVIAYWLALFGRQHVTSRGKPAPYQPGAICRKRKIAVSHQQSTFTQLKDEHMLLQGSGTVPEVVTCEKLKFSPLRALEVPAYALLAMQPVGK